MSNKTAVVLFTRDLRVTDNPALWAASRAERTVPLFVLDDAILGSRFGAPQRVAHMRRAVSRLGVGKACWAAQQRGAEELHTAADWSASARRRERALREACAAHGIELIAHPGV